MSFQRLCRLCRHFVRFRSSPQSLHSLSIAKSTRCRRQFSSGTKGSPPKPILISSEMVCGDKYDILRKEKSDRLKLPGAGALYSVFISGGWVLPQNISGAKLKLALQSAVNVFPWFSSRIIEIEDTSFTMHCNNQGIKLDTVCHPSLSINPADGVKYDQLQLAVHPEHRNMFFTEDKPHLLLSKRKWDTAPVLMVQLNHLNVSNLDEVTEDTPCVLTFKLSHGVGDGYSGYLFMRYISDYLSGADLSGYDDADYGRLFGLDECDADKLSAALEDFKEPSSYGEKYGIKSDGSPTWVIPNFAVVQQTRFQMVLTTVLQYFMPYLISMNMEYFELKFNANDIAGIRDELMNGFDDDHEFKKTRLSTYECLTAYLSPLIAKYESSTGLLKMVQIPINLRGRTTNYGENTVGICVFTIGSGVEDETGSLEYSPSNFALKLHEALNRYARIQNDEEMTMKIGQSWRDLTATWMLHGTRYMMHQTISDLVKSQGVIWNEFRSLKLYENYKFGLDQRPLFYMYGVSYTGNRFMFLDDPNDPKGVRVFIRMPKAKAKKMRDSETEFLRKYEVPADANCF